MGRRFWTVWVSSSASYLAEGLLFGSLPVLAASLTRDARLIAVTDALHHAGGTAITVWLARRDPKPVPVEGRAAPLKLLAEGLHYLAKHRVLPTLAGAVAIVNLVTSGAIAVAVLYVLQELHLPQSTYGLVMASFALGAIGGGLLTVRLTRWLGERTAVLISLAAFGISMVVLGAVRQVVVSVSAMVLMGFFSMVWNITVNSYRQRVVPLPLLGRVTSVFRMVTFITMPLGALLAGLGTHAIGLPWTYIMGGLLLFATAAAAVRPLQEMPNRP
jgi:predicted MFS family arabinose efflux permease